jgi:iron(III)-enterobactin esterase
MIFERMLIESLSRYDVEQKAIASKFMNRYMIVDLYLPKNISHPQDISLLLINDGQDLAAMQFSGILNRLAENEQVHPLLCVGIHAGKDRKNEYGTAGRPDYAGRGAKALDYERFILEELLPFISTEYAIKDFRQKGYCGFSLGGLSAVDTTWRHPSVFNTAGVFSGSLWWRSKDLDDSYNDDTDRIMHQGIREGSYSPGLKFYFTTGSLDESADRNHNGIIDSIDDTLDLIRELEQHGYSEKDIVYVNFEDGRHDVETWGRAMPGFLMWGWGVGVERF